MSTIPGEKQNAPWPMPNKSFDSVQIFWLDRPEILGRLQSAVQDLVSRHPEIEQVVLFGSLARGDAVPGSDIDLLLVLRHSEEPFLDRSIRYRPAEVGVAIDLVVYTRQELDQLLADGNAFVAQALKEGLVLFKNKLDAVPPPLAPRTLPS